MTYRMLGSMTCIGKNGEGAYATYLVATSKGDSWSISKSRVLFLHALHSGAARALLEHPMKGRGEMDHRDSPGKITLKGPNEAACPNRDHGVPS